MESRTVPALLHVTSLADDGTAGTLRSIISTANTNADTSNTIVFDVTGTIDLTMAPLNPTTGIFPGPTAFDVNKSLTILGSGQTITRDATAADFRFFFVEGTGNLSLSNLTLSNGLAQGFDGGPSGGGAAGLGGAIYNRGTLSVQGVTFTSDAAIGGAGGVGGNRRDGGGGGGGLGSSGDASGDGGNPNGSTSGGNTGDGYSGGDGGFGGGGAGDAIGGIGTGGFGAGGGGGGGSGGFGGGGGGTGDPYGGLIDAGNGGFGGGAGGFSGGLGGGGGGAGLGGAIFSEMGPVTITNSTLFGNSAIGGAGSTSYGGTAGFGYGGAVFAVDGVLTITNSTLSDNTVTNGVSQYPASDVILFGPPRGRDVYITSHLASTTAVINNSILGQTDSSISDFYASGTDATSSGGNNLIRSPGNFGGSSSTADPMLDPAGPKNNGGLTPTSALLPGSPAIDAGNNALVPGGVTTDQRGPGFARIGGPTVDIGAFEVQQNQPPPQLSPPSVSGAFGPGGLVVEIVNSAGVLTQFDATGAHALDGGVRYASVAFGPTGEVLEVVSLAGVLTQFDSSGAHQMGAGGVQSASVAFGPGGEVLDIVLVDGSLTQFDAAGAHRLGTGVESASVAVGPNGEVLEVVSTGGVLTQFDATGAHSLGGGGVQSASVAFTPFGEVLDIIFSDGSLDQFDPFGQYSLGMIS